MHQQLRTSAVKNNSTLRTLNCRLWAAQTTRQRHRYSSGTFFINPSWLYCPSGHLKGKKTGPGRSLQGDTQSDLFPMLSKGPPEVWTARLMRAVGYGDREPMQITRPESQKGAQDPDTSLSSLNRDLNNSPTRAQSCSQLAGWAMDTVP